MQLVCLDLEGVLVPEIWIEFAERTGIPELRRTNTDLMQRTHELAEANERTQKELAERVRIEQERANLQEEVIRIQSARLAEFH